MALVRVSRGETRAVEAEFRDTYGAGGETGRASVQIRAKCAVVLTVGMGFTVLGADWLVNGAIDVARARGIAEATIGLTIVAVGTSAPELATTIVATLKGDRDVAVGNLLGSSIFNIFVILGITCLVTPGGLHVERRLLLVDVPLMFSVALLCVPVFATGKRVSRAEGGMFVAIYVIYVMAIVLGRA